MVLSLGAIHILRHIKIEDFDPPLSTPRHIPSCFACPPCPHILRHILKFRNTQYDFFLTFLYLCWASTGVSRENPQGGGVFIHHFLLRLAEIKTPPQEKNLKIRFFLRKNREVGFFSPFRYEASQNKNPTPPGGFREEPLYLPKCQKMPKTLLFPVFSTYFPKIDY